MSENSRGPKGKGCGHGCGRGSLRGPHTAEVQRKKELDELIFVRPTSENCHPTVRSVIPKLVTPEEPLLSSPLSPQASKRQPSNCTSLCDVINMQSECLVSTSQPLVVKPLLTEPPLIDRTPARNTLKQPVWTPGGCTDTLQDILMYLMLPG